MVQPALAGVGIAITRPSDQAKKLTQLVETAGGYVISFPLIEIVPLDDYRQFEGVIAHIASYEWVIFISSNAVQNAMPRLLKQTLANNLKFAAIGPVTAKELQDFGVKEVLTPKLRFDSESLLSLPPMHDMQGKKVMIVRGVGGREVLAETLKSRGADVTFAECYQRVNPQQNLDVLNDAWSKQQLQAIVVTSSEAMRHLLELAANAPWLKQVTICVNHARIAEQTNRLGLKVMIADAPGDEAMFNTLLNVH